MHDVSVRNESSDEDADKSGDDARNLIFDGSEEDKTTVLNDGFEVLEVDMPKEGSNRIDINGKSYKIKMCASKSPMKKKKLTPKKKMKANFKKKIGEDTLIIDLMMGAAKATYYQAWHEKMQELKKLDTNA
ncbi:unnamed protein product [Vicia faba]|uniref:Uncharacterized protein n=1 Tax=Vicia faba TaxID=3906 RepID=A0AAV1BBA0_VICFA|nr:unnamed protein product [Vicia faba]